MRVAEVMSTDVKTVPPTTPAADAWELMRRHSIHHLVVMEGSTLVGVLSDRDVGGKRGASVRAQSRVGDLMTTATVTVEPNATVRRVANLLRGRTIGCVPVLERGRLKGIVTISDLLSVLGYGIDRPAKPRRHDLHFRVPHRKQRRAPAAW
jgi:acetoin utilization protein AcuB